MADIIITASATGLDIITNKLEGVISRSLDLTPPMKAGSLLMMGSIDKNFRSGGRPTPWVPLSPKYLKRKVSQGYSSTPLTKTGILKGSIVPSVGTHGFKIGTSSAVAPYHQFGTRKMVSRKFLVFQDQDLEDINQMTKDYIQKGE